MLFVGGMIPVVFSALAMNSVGKAAMEMVYEVRRQFKEIPGSPQAGAMMPCPSVWAKATPFLRWAALFAPIS